MAGLLSTLRSWLSPAPAVDQYGWSPTPLEGYPGGHGYLPGTQFWLPENYDVSGILSLTPTELWRTQPYLRTVVDFLARNIAQLSLHVFDRVGDTDRQRVHDGPMAALIAKPNPTMTFFDVILALVSDLALHDDAYWLISDSSAGLVLRPIPAEWITGTYGDNGFTVGGYYVTKSNNGDRVAIPAERIVHFHGWSPTVPSAGTSKVLTLKLILAEQMEAMSYRQQVWQRGGRVGTVLERPVGAPLWQDAARQQFRADWQANWTGREGPKAGGTPVLEDGMTLKRVGFSAHEDQFVESSRLNLNTVASVYHVNPTMIGLLDNANYSNVREFRRMLYGDTLGPILAGLEARINAFLLPMIGESPDRYVEFNIAEKLQGSFEEQASVMSTLVGRPIMTANEGRARFNLPAVTGGDADELIVPLNVTVGGQASPQTPVTGAASWAVGGRSKARPTGPLEDSGARALAAFFTTQQSAVMPLIASNALDWWDELFWNEMLAAAIAAVGLKVSTSSGRKTLREHDLPPDWYDVARTEDWIAEVAAVRAGWMNDTTRDGLSAAKTSADPVDAASSVFGWAIDNRSISIGATLVTMFAGFGTIEAVKQTNNGRGTKTWLVNSSHSRHPQLHRQTRDLSERFSNGADWPGDPGAGVAQAAGCLCGVEVHYT